MRERGEYLLRAADDTMLGMESAKEAQAAVVVRQKSWRLTVALDGGVTFTSDSGKKTHTQLRTDADGWHLDVSFLEHPTTQLELIGKAPAFSLETRLPTAISAASRGGLLTFADPRHGEHFETVAGLVQGPRDAELAARLPASHKNKAQAASGAASLCGTLNMSRVDSVYLLFPVGIDTVADDLHGATLVQSYLHVEPAVAHSEESA